MTWSTSAGVEFHREFFGVEARHQVAFIDPQQPNLDPVEIDGRDRQPGGIPLRQDIAGSGKADRRLAVRDDDARGKGFGGLLPGLGRKAGEQPQFIGFAVSQSVDAERVAADRHDAVETGLAAHKAACETRP